MRVICFAAWLGVECNRSPRIANLRKREQHESNRKQNETVTDAAIKREQAAGNGTACSCLSL